MRILSDLLPLQVDPTRSRGIGQYTRNALAAAIAQAPADHAHYLGAHRSLEAPAFSAQGKTPPKSVRVNFPLDRYRYDTWAAHETAWGDVWDALVERLKCDVMHVHSPFEVAAPPHRRPARARLVVTVYDLIPLIFRDLYLTRMPAWYEAHYGRAIELVKAADHIVTISQCSRHDIIERLGIGSERITVAPPGPSPAVLRTPSPGSVAEARRRFGLHNGFVLCTSGYDYRKNLPRALDAYAGLPERLRREFPLVIVCRLNADEERALRAEVIRRRIEQCVVLTNYVTDEELAALYRIATVQFFPSLYEGFGMPVLDAMACGLPVVTSNTSAMPEVAGDAALLVDPTDVAALTDALARVLESESLRAGLRTKGLARAAQFRWEAAGRGMREAYENTT